MPAPSLGEVEATGVVEVDGARLIVHVPVQWPAEGEKRIGYVSILRIVEWVRELHWRQDLLPWLGTTTYDSTTRTVTASFERPVLAGTTVICRYSVLWIRNRSYGLRVVLEGEFGHSLASADMALVFVDAAAERAISPPTAALEALQKAKVAEACEAASQSIVGLSSIERATRRGPVAPVGSRRLGNAVLS